MNCFGMAATAGIYLSFPIIIENWIEYYGTQGTYILIAGLSYHIIFAVTLFQPVEWHMIKRVPTFGELIEPGNFSRLILYSTLWSYPSPWM